MACVCVGGLRSTHTPRERAYVPHPERLARRLWRHRRGGDRSPPPPCVSWLRAIHQPPVARPSIGPRPGAWGAAQASLDATGGPGGSSLDGGEASDMTGASVGAFNTHHVPAYPNLTRSLYQPSFTFPLQASGPGRWRVQLGAPSSNRPARRVRRGTRCWCYGPRGARRRVRRRRPHCCRCDERGSTCPAACCCRG